MSEVVAGSATEITSIAKATEVSGIVVTLDLVAPKAVQLPDNDPRWRRSTSRCSSIAAMKSPNSRVLVMTDLT